MSIQSRIAVISSPEYHAELKEALIKIETDLKILGYDVESAVLHLIHPANGPISVQVAPPAPSLQQIAVQQAPSVAPIPEASPAPAAEVVEPAPEHEPVAATPEPAPEAAPESVPTPTA